MLLSLVVEGRLLCNQEAVLLRARQLHEIRVCSVTFAEFQAEGHFRRSSSSEIEQRVRPTLDANVAGEVLIHDLPQKPEHLDQVRFAGPVAPDEYVEQPQLQHLLWDGLEILDRQLF